MIAIGFFLAILFIGASVCLGGLDRFQFFFDFYSAMFVLLGIAGYVVLYGCNEFVHGIKMFFASSFPLEEKSVKAGRFFLRLSEFTLVWGFLGMILALVWAMEHLDPKTLGTPFALCLLSFFYATVLAVFIFLPIGLRLSPPKQQPSPWFAVRLSLIGLGVFFLLRFLIVLLLFSVQSIDRQDAMRFNDFGNMVLQAIFAFNPADPRGNYSWGFYWDLPSLLFVLLGWGAFRCASGKRRKWIAAPVIIFIGILGSVLGLVLMLSNLNMQQIGPGFMIGMLTALYAFIAAVGFLIADMRNDYRTLPSVSSTEDTGRAKEIIDRVVENERQ